MSNLREKMMSASLRPISAEEVEASRLANERASKLFDAVGRNNDMAEARALLDLAPELAHARNGMGRTPLAHALHWGRAEMTKFLMPLSDPSARDEAGAAPLEHAASAGFAWAVQALLPASDPDGASGQSPSALSRAALAGSLDCVRLLLAAPAANIERKDANRSQAFCVAEIEGQWACAELIALDMEPEAALQLLNERECGMERMPRLAARQEAFCLAQELALGQSESADPTPPNEKATPSRRL